MGWAVLSVLCWILTRLSLSLVRGRTGTEAYAYPTSVGRSTPPTQSFDARTGMGVPYDLDLGLSNPAMGGAGGEMAYGEVGSEGTAHT
ncbi:hypothetical protein DFH09DRAFT_1189319 [Mycena vulgaris]|nr:hypothetical protein DFH09DRAFT_1189278 [Mycena vulgaris]KAJ6524723.1 hypothetical protein DFH09DRAFT_1189319 [Mycena vulgaris]